MEIKLDNRLIYVCFYSLIGIHCLYKTMQNNTTRPLHQVTDFFLFTFIYSFLPGGEQDGKAASKLATGGR